jgi:hypothetical protein
MTLLECEDEAASPSVWKTFSVNYGSGPKTFDPNKWTIERDGGPQV